MVPKKAKVKTAKKKIRGAKAALLTNPGNENATFEDDGNEL